MRNAFAVFIEKHLHISGPSQFKALLFKGQLYSKTLSSHSAKCRYTSTGKTDRVLFRLRQFRIDKEPAIIILL